MGRENSNCFYFFRNFTINRRFLVYGINYFCFWDYSIALADICEHKRTKGDARGQVI